MIIHCNSYYYYLNQEKYFAHHILIFHINCMDQYLDNIVVSVLLTLTIEDQIYLNKINLLIFMFIV